MERVAFLIEDTGEHLGCLLNPESVVMSRTAGVEPRRSAGGKLTGTGLADDPLLFTGGGHTELRLDLLFDVDLAPANFHVQDVRQMTRPIWALAENSAEVERQRRPPSVRFVWGRAWNVPGIVTEVAERFDRFSPDGSPLRSWMRMVFVRVGQSADEEGARTTSSPSGCPRLTSPLRPWTPWPSMGTAAHPEARRQEQRPTAAPLFRRFPRESWAGSPSPPSVHPCCGNCCLSTTTSMTRPASPARFAGPLAVPPMGETP
ncbi:hypothetical protein [Arthrobacter sp. 92]|uniref:CIS tube protein n=1 Tax=Arthrobacter sp. 92 TaxID=3418175 RepID=UPI003D00EA69